MHIKMEGIDKSFGSNQVLKDAGVELRDGEIHALMGENGAGKSTLMKILTGEYTKDAGKIYVDDQEVTYHNIQEAEKAGIVFIHQELNVVQDLTVEENMFLGREIKGKFGMVDKKEMTRQAQAALDRLGVKFSPDTPMKDLSVGNQQMVEISKALMRDAKVIIMDEPTAALTQEETEVLFDIIRQLKSEGVGMVYISHRMEEIFELCDRITILRDGSYIGVRDIPDTNMDEVVKMMIGREIGERYPERDHKIGDTVLEVKNLSSDKLFHDVSFDVKAGEVLGVSGLMGAGRSEIMKTIFGDLPKTGGEVIINGKEVQIHNPLDAMHAGIGFVTEDRKVEGLMLDKSIEENISLANLNQISHNGVLDKGLERDMVDEAIRSLNIRCAGSKHEAGNLSGGNQQKVVFAKWIYTGPKILILDEPTRGVDIGAKKEIYDIINKLSREGVAVIMVSSEQPEVLGMSDRVMVVHEGEVAGFLDRKEADQEKIMTLATGGTLNAAS